MFNLTFCVPPSQKSSNVFSVVSDLAKESRRTSGLKLSKGQTLLYLSFISLIGKSVRCVWKN